MKSILTIALLFALPAYGATIPDYEHITPAQGKALNLAPIGIDGGDGIIHQCWVPIALLPASVNISCHRSLDRLYDSIIVTCGPCKIYTKQDKTIDDSNDE